MLKVILVDDEEINVELMKRVIQWEEHGFQIAGSAENGRKGLELYERVHPDVAIIDIKMPVLNGIEMIRQLKERNADVKIVILSAYGEFEYAQQAIEYGINAYLLKPINEEKLIRILQSIRESYAHDLQEKERKVRLEQELLHKQMEHDLRILQDCLDRHPSSEPPEEPLRQLAAAYSIASYVILHFRCYREDLRPEREDPGAAARIDEWVCASVHPYLLPVRKSEQETVLLLFRTDEPLIDPAEMRLAEKLKVGRESFRLACGMSYTCGISEPFRSLKDVRTAYLQAVDANSRNFYHPETGVSVYTEQRRYHADTALDWVKMEWQLKQWLQTNKYTMVLDYIEETFARFRSQNIRSEDAYSFCQRLLEFLKNEMVQMNCQWEAEPLREIALPVLQRFYSFEHLKKFMIQTVMQAGSSISDALRSKKNFAFVRKAKEYALQHYHEENFSIQQVSDYVGLSKNHFSRLFKDNTGINFWDYVIRLRMEEAKRLLRQTNATNFEIAQKIGYSSEYHFCRTFSKLNGMTASQYRKLNAYER